MYGDYIYCMTSENETERLSDIPPLDRAFIEHTVEGILYYEAADYARNFQNNFTPEEWNSLRAEEKIIGSAFQCMEDNCTASFLNTDLKHFADKTFEEKLDMLQNAYLHESAEKRVLEIECERYHDKALRRHESLLKAKGIIKSLTQENLELQNQVENLQKLLEDHLSRK